jgi:isocitrate lyase
MDLTLTITGSCCDLALHPVNAETAARVCMLGDELYKTNSIEWWRANSNNTCGMRLTADARIQATLDGQPVALEAGNIATSAAMLTQRAFLDAPEKDLCLLGYDDEACSRTWIWRNVSQYDAARFEFFVQRWDAILGVADYLVIDDICYDGRPADEAAWGRSEGFTFRTPAIVSADVARAELAAPARRAA